MPQLRGKNIFFIIFSGFCLTSGAFLPAVKARASLRSSKLAAAEPGRVYLLEPRASGQASLRLLSPQGLSRLKTQAGVRIFRDPNPAEEPPADRGDTAQASAAEGEAKNQAIAPQSYLRLEATLIVADRKKPRLPFARLEALNPLDLLPQSEEIQAPFMHDWDE